MGVMITPSLEMITWKVFFLFVCLFLIIENRRAREAGSKLVSTHLHLLTPKC